VKKPSAGKKQGKNAIGKKLALEKENERLSHELKNK
jgi:hypothetical protein